MSGCIPSSMLPKRYPRAYPQPDHIISKLDTQPHLCDLSLMANIGQHSPATKTDRNILFFYLMKRPMHHLMKEYITEMKYCSVWEIHKYFSIISCGGTLGESCPLFPHQYPWAKQKKIPTFVLHKIYSINTSNKGLDPLFRP